MTIDYKSIFLKTTTYILYLYPLSLIFSVFFSNFTIFLVSLYSIFNFSEIKKELIYKSTFFKLFVIFWILISLRSFLSEDFLFSLKSSVLFIKYLLFLFGVILVSKKVNKFLNNFSIILILVLFIVMIDAFVQFYFGSNLIGYKSEIIENNRISGFFGDELILGSYVVRLTFLSIALILLTNIKKKKILIFILIFLSFSTALISGERSAFYLSFMSILYFSIQTYMFRLRDKLIVLSLIISTFFVFLSFSEKVQHRVKMTFKDLNSTDNVLTFSGGHKNHYETAFNLFKDNILFGHGANTFRKKCSDKRYFVEPSGCSTHPHNMYFQILAETGLIGFIFVFLLFLKTMILSFKHFYFKYFKKTKIFSDYEICILTGIIINFWPLIPTGNFFGSVFGNIAILSIAFAFINQKKSLI